jgi:mannitol operon repressor
MAETKIEKRTRMLLEHMAHSAGESDRGLVLFLAAQMEKYLRDVLESFLVDDKKSVTDFFEGPHAPFGTLSAKTKAAFVLGLITRKEVAWADAVRKVRNVFAHEIDASFDHVEVKKLCAKPPIADGRLCDRDAFLHSGMNAVLPIVYRSMTIKHRSELTEQRKGKRKGG